MVPSKLFNKDKYLVLPFWCLLYFVLLIQLIPQTESLPKDLFLLRSWPEEKDSPSDEIIFVKEGDTFIRIQRADILYIQGMENYVKLQFADKNIVVHETMNGIEKILPQPTFFRVHRSYIANLSKAKSISIDHLIINNTALPIAKNRRKELMENIIYKNLLNG